MTLVSDTKDLYLSEQSMQMMLTKCLTVIVMLSYAFSPTQSLSMHVDT